MDWEANERERKAAIQIERTRLLNLSEDAAMAEGTPIWYQRMRYLREIEASEYINRVQNCPSTAAMSTRYSGYGRGRGTKVIYPPKD